MAFKMRSGGGAVPFKQMGSTPSPLKKTYKEAYAEKRKKRNDDEGVYHNDNYSKEEEREEADFTAAAKAWNMKTYGTHNPTADAKKGGMTKAELAAKHKASGAAKPAKAKPEAKEDKVTRQQVIHKEDPKTGAVTSTIQSAKGKGKTVNKDRPYDPAIDSKSTPKAEPTKKEARVAKRTERKEARTERKDTRRQARDMKEIGKLVAKDDKNKSRRAKNQAKYSPTTEQYAAAEKAIKSRT